MSASTTEVIRHRLTTRTVRLGRLVTADIGLRRRFTLPGRH